MRRQWMAKGFNVLQSPTDPPTTPLHSSDDLKPTMSVPENLAELRRRVKEVDEIRMADASHTPSKENVLEELEALYDQATAAPKAGDATAERPQQQAGASQDEAQRRDAEFAAVAPQPASRSRSALRAGAPAIVAMAGHETHDFGLENVHIKRGQGSHPLSDPLDGLLRQGHEEHGTEFEEWKHFEEEETLDQMMDAEPMQHELGFVRTSAQPRPAGAARSPVKAEPEAKVSSPSSSTGATPGAILAPAIALGFGAALVGSLCIGLSKHGNKRLRRGGRIGWRVG